MHNKKGVPKINSIKEDVLHEAKLFDRIFSSPEGEKVLKVLEGEFFFSPICLPNGDSRSDSVRSAQTDVITFIHLNIKIGKGEQNAN